jgi:6-phosphogluconolactonase
MSGPGPGQVVVYVGTDTNDPHGGIHVLCLDTATGALQPVGKSADVGNPFFVALDSSHGFLYAANAVDQTQGQPGGGVCAFAIDPRNGALTALNQQPACGETPCYVSIDQERTCALVANYSSGDLAVLPLQESGELNPASCTISHEGSSVDPNRQEGPHIHCIVFDPGGRYAFAADLGTDQVRIYQLDAAAGQLTPNPRQAFAQIAAGSGPRHIAFHPDGRHAYLINELGNTLTVFDYDSVSGTLAETQTVSTLPADCTDTSYCADVQFHPSGRYIYGTNRGHDSIAVFAIDPESGHLSLVEIVPAEGSYPWNLAVDPTGQYLLSANQRCGNVAVFRLDPDDGTLTFTGHKVDVPRAVCVEMLAL